MTPEKLHLALNHLPLLGFTFALIPLLYGLFARNQTALLLGFIIATIGGWATPFIMGTGEAAYERYKSGEVRQHLDAAAIEALERHEEIGHKGSKLLYATAVISTIGLVVSIYRPRHSSRSLAWLLVFMCLVSVTLAIWIADSGGKIRRPDFRSEMNQTHELMHPIQTEVKTG